MVLTVEDVYRLDINSKWLGIPTEFLMEAAGKNVAEEVIKNFSNANKIAVICSKTNNGGDGLVAARYLSYRYKVAVIFIGYPELIRSSEARKNWEIINKLSFVEKHIIKRREDIQKLDELLRDANVIVDAIFGIGIRGAPKGIEGEAIETINMLKKKYGFKIVSVDVPSGYDAHQGKKTERTVDSDIIVTFHDKKIGFDKLDKKIVVKSIGIPKEAEIFVGPGDLLNFLKPRKNWSHKGEFGKILIIGGSKHYHGAPTLSALAALKTGADLAILLVPKEISLAIRALSPNLIVETYEGESLGDLDTSLIDDIVSKINIAVVGPGIGPENETLAKAHKIISNLAQRIPVIVDADALKAIAKYGIPRGNIIITPHAGEFKYIFGEDPTTDPEKRMAIVKKHAKEKKITIILKGYIDTISDGSRVRLNKTGNPGMTVGGTGDVLTGVVAAVRAQVQDNFEAACIATFLNGLAGDIAYESLGYSLTATDVIENIPNAITKIKKFIYS